MLLCRILLGAALGAVLVKESSGASRLYDSVRTEIMALLDALRPKPKQNEDPVGDGPESSAEPESN